ncbi:hypothetical protein ACFPPA_14110 [Rhodanobacter ginsengisoli]|uniref:Uncharacterized protein n=1 Tax=Rhodanobacter ginsengisoli TaxID=418646 RepID=A0ABW0QQT1_9GAMM
MRIELHIERLVLDDALLGGERATAVRSAIELELAERLAGPEVESALRGIGSVASLPPAVLPQARHPKERLGPRIATAVGQALGVGGTHSSQAHRQRRQPWPGQK